VGAGRIDAAIARLLLTVVSGAGVEVQLAALRTLRGTSDLRGMLKHGAETAPLQASGAVQIMVAPVGDGALAGKRPAG
jgi:hypothetical protein